MSVLGGTTRLASPLKVTSPTWMPFGTSSTKFLACSSIAARRDGDTSVALIEAEVSSVRMIVARSFAVFIVMAGWANARVRTTSERSVATAGHVPTPGGPLRRDGVEQVDAGEAQHLGVPATLHEHVGDEEGEGREEQDEAPARQEGHRAVPD